MQFIDQLFVPFNPHMNQQRSDMSLCIVAVMLPQTLGGLIALTDSR